MSGINAQNDIFSSLGLSAQQNTQAPENDASKLGLDTFLKLMITQLNNQDPFKPMENGEFLGQIAQFGSVTGLDNLNKKMDELTTSLTSGQALQAGSLIGREVLAPVDTGYLQTGGSLRGQVTLDASSSEVTMRVTDQAGQLVKELPLGAAQSGEFKFTWDGTNNNGDFMAPGLYNVQISALQGSTQVEQQTNLFAEVESVNLSGGTGLTLNLQGLGPVAFNNVNQIF